MSANALVLIALLSSAAKAGDLGVTAFFQGSEAFRAQIHSQPGRVVFETGESSEISEAWDTVLFQGLSPDAGLTFEASRREASGDWGPWQPVNAMRYPNGRFWGKATMPRGPGKLRLRARDVGVGENHRVEIFSVEVFSADDAEAVGPDAIRAPLTPRPLVHGRAQWDAATPHSPYIPDAPARLTLHHTEGAHTQTLAESLKEIGFIQDYHIKGRGWNDIAYHFLIDAAGNIFEGRPEGTLGAHTMGANPGNVGIAMLGSFHPPRNDAATSASLEAAVSLGRYFVGRYKISPQAFKGHRDYRSTDCPGDGLYSLMARLRERLAPRAPTAPIELARWD